MTTSGPFHDPKRIAINRVYTGQGDRGRTSLVGGQKVPKSELRIAAYGEIDELNAFVGRARATLADAQRAAAFDTPDENAAGDRATSGAQSPPRLDASVELRRLDRVFARVQHELFNLGSILATLPEDVHPAQPRIRPDDHARLEREMDRCNAWLEPLRSFVLPGGNPLGADLHVCRTVCRRAERTLAALAESSDVDPDALIYVNRLSDAFFVWSRWAGRLLDTPEILWSPNAVTEEIDP